MQAHGITKIVISNLLSTRKRTKNIFGICKEHQFYYIDNNNIYASLLYKDCLHLLYELLAKDVVTINTVIFFGQTHTSPKNTFGENDGSLSTCL